MAYYNKTRFTRAVKSLQAINETVEVLPTDTIKKAERLCPLKLAGKDCVINFNCTVVEALNDPSIKSSLENQLCLEGKTLEVEGKAIPHIDILLYGAMNYGVITTKKIRASAKKEVNWSRVCGELFPMNDDDDFDFVDVYWNPMISCWNEFNFEYVKFTEAGNPDSSLPSAANDSAFEVIMEFCRSGNLSAPSVPPAPAAAAAQAASVAAAVAGTAAAAAADAEAAPPQMAAAAPPPPSRATAVSDLSPGTANAAAGSVSEAVATPPAAARAVAAGALAAGPSAASAEAAASPPTGAPTSNVSPPDDVMAPGRAEGTAMVTTAGASPSPGGSRRLEPRTGRGQNSRYLREDAIGAPNPSPSRRTQGQPSTTEAQPSTTEAPPLSDFFNSLSRVPGEQFPNLLQRLPELQQHPGLLADLLKECYTLYESCYAQHRRWNTIFQGAEESFNEHAQHMGAVNQQIQELQASYTLLCSAVLKIRQEHDNATAAGGTSEATALPAARAPQVEAPAETPAAPPAPFGESSQGLKVLRLQGKGVMGEYFQMFRIDILNNGIVDSEDRPLHIGKYVVGVDVLRAAGYHKFNTDDRTTCQSLLRKLDKIKSVRSIKVQTVKEAFDGGLNDERFKAFSKYISRGALRIIPVDSFRDFFIKEVMSKLLGPLNFSEEELAASFGGDLGFLLEETPGEDKLVSDFQEWRPIPVVPARLSGTKRKNGAGEDGDEEEA